MLVAIIAMCSFFAGCGDTVGTGLPHSGNKYALVVKSEGNQYFEAIYDGFSEVIESQGGAPIIGEPSEPTAEAQISVINDLVSSGVSCIAIASNSKTAIAPALGKAMEKGIKVLSFDSAVEPASRALHVNQADARVIARELMDAAADISGGKGQIAIMSTTNQAANQNMWIEEMRKLLEEGAYPGLTLVNIVYGEDDYDITFEKTQYLIDTYPELSVIIAPTAAGIPAVAECIRVNGLEQQIRVTGLGMPSQMAEYIGDDKVCPYMFLWDLDEVGKLTAYAAIALVDGTITGQVGETLVAGDAGEYSITEDPLSKGGSEIVLQAAPVRFDQSNIDYWKDIF
jgi:rhamnose transport system substrate-binding protein